MSAVEIHSSNLAGSWYPADPEELRADIERFLGEERRPDPALRAILVPHAGYRYSGKTAGAAFARVGRARWHRAGGADVAQNGDAILERLRSGTMPCDGAWPDEQVAVFADWIEAGTPA